MSCQDFQWRLPLYVAEELAPEEYEDVRQHLETCPDCASMVATLEFAEENLKFKPCVAPSAKRLARLEALLRADHKKLIRWWRLLPLAAAAAILLVVTARLFTPKAPVVAPPVTPAVQPVDYATAHLQAAQRKPAERIELARKPEDLSEGAKAGMKGREPEEPRQPRSAVRRFQKFLPFPLLYPDYLPEGLILEEARMIEETNVVQMTFAGNERSLSIFQAPAPKPVAGKLTKKMLPSGKVLTILSQQVKSYAVTAASEHFEEKTLSKVLNSLRTLEKEK